MQSLENKNSHSEADADIRDVEGWPMEVADIEIEEVDNIAKSDPINKIPHRSPQNEGERGNEKTFGPFSAMKNDHNENKGYERHNNEEWDTESGRGPREKPKSCPEVSDISEIEEIVDNRENLMELKSRLNQQFCHLV